MVNAIRDQAALKVGNSRELLTGSWIVGIFSHDASRARQYADEHLIPHAFANLTDLFNHNAIECIYISSHPRHHAQSALAVLAAGKHVLCEAPIALDIEDAVAVAHTARSRNVVFAMNFQRRADPALRTMRNMLAENAIGDLLGGRIDNTVLLETRMQTWRLRGGGGGVILNRMMHDIDTLRFLLRDEVQSVQARSTQQVFGNAVEEDVTAHITMRRSGLVFQLHDSFILPHVPTSLRVFGSTGTLIARHCFEDDTPSQLILYRNGHESPIRLDDLHPYQEAVRVFNAAIRDLTPPLATAADGVQSLTAALAALESIRRGHMIPIDLSSRPISDRTVQ